MVFYMDSARMYTIESRPANRPHLVFFLVFVVKLLGVVGDRERFVSCFLCVVVK